MNQGDIRTKMNQQDLRH